MSRRRKDGSRDDAGMEAEESKDGRDVPERWSARRKSEVVLRLLCGEEIDTVSRETQVPIHELETWRRVFLERGTSGLRKREGSSASDREGKRALAKARELTMKIELLEWLTHRPY